jgi:hypothetical protein
MGTIMTSRLVSGLFSGLLVAMVSTDAMAQVATPPPAPAPTVVSDAPPESAFLLQARMQTQQSILSVVGTSPGFLVGYQLKSVAVGLGFALTRLGVTTDSRGSSTSATLFQLSPTLIVDVWQSNDKRTRANLVASAGYGKASATDKSVSCLTDVNGVQTCNTSEGKTSATLIPIQVGFGGDHYLSRHFGIGAEAGVQLMFMTGLEANGQSIDGSANMQSLYGLLRMTLLIGE